MFTDVNLNHHHPISHISSPFLNAFLYYPTPSFYLSPYHVRRTYKKERIQKQLIVVLRRADDAKVPMEIPEGTGIIMMIVPLN